MKPKTDKDRIRELRDKLDRAQREVSDLTHHGKAQARRILDLLHDRDVLAAELRGMRDCFKFFEKQKESEAGR